MKQIFKIEKGSCIANMRFGTEWMNPVLRFTVVWQYTCWYSLVEKCYTYYYVEPFFACVLQQRPDITLLVKDSCRGNEVILEICGTSVCVGIIIEKAMHMSMNLHAFKKCPGRSYTNDQCTRNGYGLDELIKLYKHWYEVTQCSVSIIWTAL